MMTSVKKTVLVSAISLVALTLAGCSQGAETTSEPSVTTVTATPDATASASASSQSTDESTASGADGVADTAGLLAVIDAALNAHPGGVVVQVDRDDSGSESYDVDVVLNDVVHDLTYDEAGNLTEEQTDDDTDDGSGDDSDEVARASTAQVLAADAVRTAAEGRAGQVATDVDLDDQSGALAWEVEFDDADGQDAGTVHVDALTGDVIPES
ncbi:PepSY domain-containing protein [Rothia nasisuis]|uniref:PepSY domain-containing protein n=1 Tax=Rothia nasisuis TaxID=2109647 RepID=UPI001F1723BE|nr:PepSY domain-containing protein [Rothia nasisuis]